MKKRLMALTLAFVLSTGPLAAAAPVSVTRDDQREVMVTIYNGNLGLVKDLREARLPAGMSEVQFMDVAALIDPTTVHLKSLTDALGLKILEQNYEYDLLTSQKLMEKYVGRKVRLYQGDGTFLPRGDAALDQRAGLRDQQPDSHGPLRPARPALAAREPRGQAHARVAPPQPDGAAAAH